MRWIFAVLLIVALPAWPAPYTPASDAQVLERVPPARDPRQIELESLRRLLNASPDNPDIATRYARLAIERGRALGDPRYFGYAQAALTPWRELESPPLSVRVLRATLLQQRHDFAGALAELDRALEQQPDSGQARLTRATVLLTQGQPQAAQADCAALSGRTSDLVLAACLAGARSINGRAAEAIALLERALVTKSTAEPAVRLWAETLLAEIQHRLGNHAAAGAAFTRVLEGMRKSGSPDLYLLAAYADFLLDADQPAAVLALLQDTAPTDALLLRQAMAAQVLAGAGAGGAAMRERSEFLRRELSGRFSASRARADTVHLREETLFELRVTRAPARAVELAARNWQSQREPIDARLLLEAAHAANNRSAAQPVLNWMDETGIEDVALNQLRARLDARP